MSIAVGMPKNVQLPVRRVSSRNRTTAYQMKKISSRSPGRIRGPQRRAIHSRVTAPRIPLIDSYRNSGWKPVVASRVHRARVQRRRGGRSRW